MKHANPMLALLLLLPLANSRGADARKFHGVDLFSLREVKGYPDMPEIYELDREARGFRMVESSFHVQFDGAWIILNPTLNVFYLNKVPGENETSNFGPVKGDPFDMFKLEDLYLSKFRENYAPDEMYRIRLMLRSGNPKLRERALRVIKAALAPEVKLSARTANVHEFRTALEEHKGEDLEPVFAVIKETEKAIYDAMPVYPDDQYAPGNDALETQGKFKDWMKLPGPVPGTAWGEPYNGLRAAALFSPVTAEVGGTITVWLVVENVSDHQIKFAIHDIQQSARAVVKRQDGSDVKVTSTLYTGLSPIYRHRLQSKERLTVGQVTLVFNDDAAAAGFGESRAIADAGEYRVKYGSVLGNGTAKDEWGGHLTTGETKITISAKAAAATPPTRK
jgi:hypothetical protein